MSNVIDYCAFFLLFFWLVLLELVKPLRNIYITDDNGYVVFVPVPIIIRSFPYSLLVTGSVTRETERVPHAEQELLTRIIPCFLVCFLFLMCLLFYVVFLYHC